MKKLCLIIAYLFLFTQTASAMPLLVGQKVVYRGTVTNLRISAVDGTAFIDNAGATIPTYADGNHQIEIYDSSNRMLKGVLKAAGSAETLGSALNVSNCINSGTLPYSTFDGASATGFHIISSGTGDFRAGSADELNFTGQWLVKATLDATLTSGEAPTFSYCQDNFGIYIAGALETTLVAGGNTIYRTVTIPTTGQVRFRNTAATETTIANMAIKQVLTPSSSGATIVSAKGGTTYNFSYKNASFTYNASSYYVIIRAIR